MANSECHNQIQKRIRLVLPKKGVPWIPSTKTPVMLAFFYQHQPDPSWVITRSKISARIWGVDGRILSTLCSSAIVDVQDAAADIHGGNPNLDGRCCCDVDGYWNGWMDYKSSVCWMINQWIKICSGWWMIAIQQDQCECCRDVPLPV